MIELINADCQDIMPKYEDNYFDLAVCDVPYGIGEDGSKSKSREGFGLYKGKTKYVAKNWDKSLPTKEYFNELIRISKNQIIWGANHFVSKIPYDSSCWIVWDKDNSTCDFADCELAWTSFKTAVRLHKYKWHGMLQQNMKHKEHRIHPTQKPIALYKWLLENYAEKGMKIFDSHMGSGSSAIAAHYYGCDFVGIEIDKEYFDAAKKRIEKETLQLEFKIG